jgi:phage baseplate assembly protein W
VSTLFGPLPGTSPEEASGAQIGFPFRLDARGRVAGAGYPQHVRQLVEQLLFTSPGERVNRPDFGCGLHELVFAPDNDALAGATQFLVMGALQRWLGDVLEPVEVRVDADDASLRVAVRYTLLAGGEPQVEVFRR